MNVSAQVFDGVYARPAAGLPVRLERSDNSTWDEIATVKTGSDGNISQFAALPLPQGLYRMAFDSDYYFSMLGVDAAYPEVMIHFRVKDESVAWKLLVLLAPNTYSAYFGVAG